MSEPHSRTSTAPATNASGSQPPRGELRSRPEQADICAVIRANPQRLERSWRAVLRLLPSTPFPTRHQELVSWVDEIAALTEPDRIVWCNGSEAEYERLCEELVEKGTFTKLDPVKRPHSYYAASDPSDVARVEDRTFICSEKEEDAGPDEPLEGPRGDADRLPG